MKIKETLVLLIFALMGSSLFAQTHILKGIVQDDKNNPLAFVNIFIVGTIDGTSSDENGNFVLETDADGMVILKASLVGYISFEQKISLGHPTFVSVKLKSDNQLLDEVVVSASSFQLKGGSTLQQKSAVDLVTTAGSVGDLYRSLAMLPGTQVPGVDGKLLVRGGSSRESQTYIDEMRVLIPYTSMPENVGVRGRYSPFLFEGINFSMGGYSSEYAQGLSSVVPLSTKNESNVTKTGASITSVGLGAGGTKSWKKASTSFNVDYTNIGPYNNLFFPNERDLWTKPYTMLSAQNQVRFNLGENAHLKTYFAYDKTRFNETTTTPFMDDTRDMNFDEDNIYLNTTFRSRFRGGVNFFAGAAISYNSRQIDKAMVKNDMLHTKESELHLKTKVEKRFSNLYKLGGGIESFIKAYDFVYQDTNRFASNLHQVVNATFLSNDFSLYRNLILNISSRLEYTSLNKSFKVLPRVALNYDLKGITFSAIYGKYQQLAENDYLLRNRNLSSENCGHYILGANTQIKDKIYRVEVYRKKYDKLTAFSGNDYNSQGFGFSNGVDLFFNDRSFFKHWEYMITYSYNDSKRKYLDFPDEAVPQYATKHNTAITIKYNLLKYKSIIGISNRFASGRTYNNPNKEGFLNSRTPNFNSLDFAVTYLAHKKLIIYASASNILNRKNIFDYQFSPTATNGGRFDQSPTMAFHNQFFFIGFFISLSGKVAYDTSNF